MDVRENVSQCVYIGMILPCERMRVSGSVLIRYGKIRDIIDIEVS